MAVRGLFGLGVIRAGVFRAGGFSVGEFAVTASGLKPTTRSNRETANIILPGKEFLFGCGFEDTFATNSLI